MPANSFPSTIDTSAADPRDVKPTALATQGEEEKSENCVWNELWVQTREEHSNSQLWDDLVQMAEKSKKGDNLKLVFEEYLRYYPHNVFYPFFFLEILLFTD
jgi:hypothetical protein